MGGQASVVLRPASPHEAGELSALALRSKAHWGDDDAFLAACDPALTTRPDQCDGVRLVVAEQSGRLLGFVRLDGAGGRGELADLFVDPSAMGRGIGRRLLGDALDRAAGLGMTVLEIDADPHAEAFHLRAGAVRTGSVPSGVVPGRVLPRLELAVPRRAGPPR